MLDPRLIVDAFVEVDENLLVDNTGGFAVDVVGEGELDVIDRPALVDVIASEEEILL